MCTVGGCQNLESHGMLFSSQKTVDVTDDHQLPEIANEQFLWKGI
jgi:hypothetical protein